MKKFLIGMLSAVLLAASIGDPGAGQKITYFKRK